MADASLASDMMAPPPREADPELRFLLHDVPWATYVVLRDTLDGHSGLKLTYLEGALELMSPSETHEDVKKIIARLLEAWAEERDVDLNGRGGATFRSEAKKRGLEPDECYSIGPFGERPDLALEVVIASGLVDKLSVYAGLRVPEVWVWRAGRIQVHALVGEGYEVRERSALLPELDLAELASLVAPGESQTRIVKAYRAKLRAR